MEKKRKEKKRKEKKRKEKKRKENKTKEKKRKAKKKTDLEFGIMMYEQVQSWTQYSWVDAIKSIDQDNDNIKSNLIIHRQCRLLI